MCDMIIKNLPWLVEHVGGLALAWQIVLAFAVIAAILAAYSGVKALTEYEYTAPRKKPRTRFNWLSRWQWLSDSDPAEADWIDAELAELAEVYEDD